MTSLISQRECLQNQIEHLQEKEAYLTEVCGEKQRETADCERRTYEAKEQLAKDCERLETLRGSIAAGEAELADVEKRGRDLMNFVESNESTPLMQIVRREFRKIEDEMIDYAAYLEWDPLYSSLSYEPLPFRAMENDMREDLKWGVLELQMKNKPLEPKIQKMVDLVNSFYTRFNRKVLPPPRRTKR